MPALNLSDSYVTLSAMITPALFMTANGSLIISTSNRMSRIVDRIRTLNEVADSLDRGVVDVDYLALRRTHLAEQLLHLEWRSDRVRIALTMLYVALSAFVGTSLGLAFDVILGSKFVALPTVMAMAGVALMLAATVNLTFEALRALGSNREELRFYRSLQTRRQADRERDAGSPADG
jgi:Protein of unknown function (DUF2721)